MASNQEASWQENAVHPKKANMDFSARYIQRCKAEKDVMQDNLQKELREGSCYEDGFTLSVNRWKCRDFCIEQAPKSSEVWILPTQPYSDPELVDLVGLEVVESTRLAKTSEGPLSCGIFGIDLHNL